MNETDEAPEKLSDVYFDIDICYDPRVQWFKERILSFTGIQDEEVFYNMLGEGNTRQKLASFILTPIRHYDLSLDRRVFFISKIIVDKLIHEEKEFTEWRIIPPPPPPVVQHRKGKKGKKAKVEAPVEFDPEATEDDDKIRGKSGKVVRAGKGTKVAKKSAKIKDEAEIDTVAATVTEPFDLDTSKASENPEGKPKVASDDTFPLPPENLDPEIDGVLEYYTVVRSVPRMVQYPKLIASFGALTPQTVDRSRKYIYFIRQCQDEIPLAENGYITKLTMPEYMLVGSTSGKILMSLGTQLKETFISLYENQSREILTTSREDEQPMMDRKSSEASGEVALEVNYLRPSDYRRMSNIARGENAARRCV